MAVERTFSIIKPDAVARNLTGAINAMIEQAGLRMFYTLAAALGIVAEVRELLFYESA